MLRTAGRLIAIGIAVPLLCSCGAIDYSMAILDAQEAIALAEAQNSDELAPYEFTFASEHLRKAREEVGQADYQAAVEMARVAEEFARKAAEIARQRRRAEGR